MNGVYAVNLSPERRAAMARLAEALILAWYEDRIGAPPDDALPATRLEADTAFAQLVAWSAPDPGAHKLGATAEGALQAMGLEAEFFGPIAPARTLASPARIAASALRQFGVEPEIAFVFARDLPPNDPEISAEAVLAALGGAAPAIEIPQSRFATLGAHGALALIADAGAAGFAIIGQVRPFSAFDPLRQTSVRLLINGAPAAEGSSAAIAGGPLAALTRHCQAMARAGVTLKAGLAVLTGSCAGWTEAPAGALVTADFDGLGEVSLIVADAAHPSSDDAAGFSRGSSA